MRATIVNGIIVRKKEDIDYLNLMESKTFQTPSSNTLKEIFIHFYSQRREDLEKEMFSHPCSWVAWDHTFWIALIIHNGSQSPFKGYFICVNQVN